MLKQNTVNKSIDKKIDIFWKEFKHFTHGVGSYSYQSSWFDNDDTLSGQFYLWQKMHSLPLTEVLAVLAVKPPQSILP